MRTRVCTRCGEEKPETDEYFYRHKRCRDGLNPMCKSCTKESSRRWRAENPENVRESERRWKAKNPEKAREAVRRWRAENPEKVKEAVRRWRAENPEKQRESERRWHAENPEKMREAQKRSKRRQVGTLAPGYLKHLISKKYYINRSEIGEELIEAKRREIKYYRQFKQLKTT